MQTNQLNLSVPQLSVGTILTHRVYRCTVQVTDLAQVSSDGSVWVMPVQWVNTDGAPPHMFEAEHPHLNLVDFSQWTTENLGPRSNNRRAKGRLYGFKKGR